jgi:hypothetical protein
MANILSSDIQNLIGVVESAAPNVAKLLAGPLAGTIADGVVNALQAAGIGADLPRPVNYDALAEAASRSPIAAVTSALAILEQQTSGALGNSNSLSGKLTPQLPHSDAGTQVNGTDSTMKIVGAVLTGIIGAVAVVAPNTANLLTQYGIPAASFLVSALLTYLHSRTVSKSNANTVAAGA